MTVTNDIKEMYNYYYSRILPPKYNFKFWSIINLFIKEIVFLFYTL